MDRANQQIKVFEVKPLDQGRYRMPDGIIVRQAELPVGAAWFADRWFRKGPDDRTLLVCVPEPHGETGKRIWIVDERASNCTMPSDDLHRCWCRHGSPADGTLHVDKVGVTCAAGAGSIITEGWHGFLHNGHLVSC